MIKIDFTKELYNYWKLINENDIKKINDFFNQEEILNILYEIEKDRKKIILFSLIIFIIAWISFLFFEKYIIYILIALIIVFSILIILFIKNKSVKQDIFPKFVKIIDNDIIYSENEIIAINKNDIDKLIKNQFLKKFDEIAIIEETEKYIIEDSIIYKIYNENNSNTINFYWAEIATSFPKKIRKNWKDEKINITTNHCYIIKINFLNPKFKIKTPILIKNDNTESKKSKKIIYLFFISFLITLWLFSILFNLWIELKSYYIFIWFLIFVMIYYLYMTITYQKKKVNLENIEFEKKFDVSCDDEIESRKLLTNDFMYRILDFSNKISIKRKYSFYFEDNFFYIKLDLIDIKNWYMEVNTFKNIFKNLKDYIHFYIEIKNIESLTNDLKLFYFDTWSYNKKITK